MDASIPFPMPAAGAPASISATDASPTERRLRVLVCGARGFIGRAVCRALRARGHLVLEGVSRAGAEGVPMDFVRDQAAADWLPRLRGVDVVVNAVGMLRSDRARPMQAVHEDAPCALFAACAASGTRRVIQLSALGITDSPFAYARTKQGAERRLDALTREGRLDGVIVRPSVVFGREGVSSRLFLALSRWPALLLPEVVRTRAIQPVAVDELAQVIAALAEGKSAPAAADAGATIIDAVGPEPVVVSDFIASLRAQSGASSALVGRLPDALARWSAGLGDRLPGVPWCSTTLALLARDNVGDPGPFAALLGRPATAADRLLGAVQP